MAADASAFVGRTRERATLVDRLDRAFGGAGNAVAVVGEAGIGKSTLIRWLAEIAAERGAVVARGQCIESAFAPSFAPWGEVLQACVEATGPDKLTRVLGHHAPALVRLIPDMLATLPDPGAARPLTAHEERVRLGAAVSRLVGGAPEPLVLILEDLQWADQAGLDLLEYTASALALSRTLLVVTYRETGAAMLLAAEGTLRRDADLAYLPLGGLSIDDVASLAEWLAGRSVSAGQVAAIAAETGGNPFYVRELVRHLEEEGTLVDGPQPAALGVPKGVRAVVARRVARLPTDAANLLTIAAAFSGSFGVGPLIGTSGLPEDRLLDAIDALLEAGLLRSEGNGRYCLSHALVRRAILDGLNPDRRARLRRRLAEALVAIGGEAAEVASQFHASRTLPGADKGLPYALAAAAEAREVKAYEQAVTLMELAVDLAETATPVARAEAFSGLAVARAEALEVDAAPAAALMAAEELIRVGKPEANAAQLLERVARTLAYAGAATRFWRPLVDRGLQLEAEALVHARLKLLDDRYEEIASGPIYVGCWLGFDPEAVAVARASGDEELFAATLSAFEWRSRGETEALIAHARTFRQPDAILRTLDVAARDLLHRQADYRATQSVLEEMLWIAERFGSVAGQAEAHYGLAKCQAILGDLARARRSAAEVPRLVARLGPVHRLQTMSKTALFLEIGYLGGTDWQFIADASETFARSPEACGTAIGAMNAAFAALASAESNQPARAEALLAALAPALERMDRRAYMQAASIDVAAAALWQLQNRAQAPRWAALARAIDREAGTAPIGCVELTRARLASLSGQPRQAAAEFSAARRVLEARFYPGARAIVDFDEARHLWSLDRDRARELARAAIDQFVALTMAPWIGRAKALLSSSRADHLTERELEVISLLAGGASNKEIAKALSLSVATVTRHIANIYPKIGARSRADATRYALEQGIIRRSA